MAAGYDGPPFQSGQAPIGYGDVTGDPFVTNVWGARDGQPAPPSGSRYSAYFRTTFTPTNAVTDINISGIIDDGAIVYINGAEIARTTNFDARRHRCLGSPHQCHGQRDGGGVTADIPVNLPAGVEATIAVSVHSASVTSSDMGNELPRGHPRRP